VTTGEFNYPTVSQSGGERNKGNSNIYVGNTDDHASNSHVSLTSDATPIHEEIPPLIDEMVGQFSDVIHAMT